MKSKSKKLKFKANVMKFGKGRKIVEIPKCVRDDFDPGDRVEVKLKEKKQNETEK